MSKLADNYFAHYDPWWMGLLPPKDDRWQTSPFQKEMNCIVPETVTALKSYGIAWLGDADET